jgi:cation:H+ antiporter
MEYLILILALIGIVIGADQLVAGAVEIARRYKVSDFVIGAAIVGIGTSMPELTVSFIGALDGNSAVAIGNVVGSNIFNVLGILGLTALFFPVAVTKENLRFEIPVCIGVSVLLTLLTFNLSNPGESFLSRPDGWILLAAFAAFMWYSFYRDKRQNTSDNNTVSTEIQVKRPLWLSVIKVVGGLTILIFSCDLFVDNAVEIARKLGLSDAFISITLIACGTSLPELAASITAAFRKNTQLALGNIIGSNIFNICLILGLSSQVTPLSSPGINLTDYFVMIGAAVLVMILGLKGRIGRLGGALMAVLFIIYTWYLLYGQLA